MVRAARNPFFFFFLIIKKPSYIREQWESTRTTILHVEVPKGMFNWELVIRDHSDDLNQLWGRIHGFRWCINPRRTRGSQLGREKQRHESVKALRNVRESFVLPLVLQNFRRAFPASLGLPRPQGRRHIGKREDLGEEVVRTEKRKSSILL